MDDKQQIEALKMLVISLAKAYQQNYDRFAASGNYSYEVKNELPEEAYDNIIKVFYNFCTIQGSSYRDLVEELSRLPLENTSKVSIDSMRELFSYDRESLRKTIYNDKYTPEAKAKKLEELKKIWLKKEE